MNQYQTAFSIGYFYGRVFPSDDMMPELPEQDAVYQTNPGFAFGIEAGRNDYTNIDLTNAALSATPE